MKLVSFLCALLILTFIPHSLGQGNGDLQPEITNVEPVGGGGEVISLISPEEALQLPAPQPEPLPEPLPASMSPGAPLAEPAPTPAPPTLAETPMAFR